MTDFTTALDRARPGVPDDARTLEELQALLRGEDLLGVGDVANMFGIAETTVRNWVDRGVFPCATVTAGGHRRFRLPDLLALKASVQEIEAENAEGRVEIPDFGDGDPYAR